MFSSNYAASFFAFSPKVFLLQTASSTKPITHYHGSRRTIFDYHLERAGLSLGYHPVRYDLGIPVVT
jgi:hypothetical protein